MGCCSTCSDVDDLRTVDIRVAASRPQGPKGKWRMMTSYRVIITPQAILSILRDVSSSTSFFSFLISFFGNCFVFFFLKIEPVSIYRILRSLRSECIHPLVIGFGVSISPSRLLTKYAREKKIPKKNWKKWFEERNSKMEVFLTWFPNLVFFCNFFFLLLRLRVLHPTPSLFSTLFDSSESKVRHHDDVIMT